MIAYEIQLRYVIRDKIRDKIQCEKEICPKINCRKKNSQIWSRTELFSRISSAFFELSQTN